MNKEEPKHPYYRPLNYLAHTFAEKSLKAVSLILGGVGIYDLFDKTSNISTKEDLGMIGMAILVYAVGEFTKTCRDDQILSNKFETLEKRIKEYIDEK